MSSFRCKRCLSSNDDFGPKALERDLQDKEPLKSLKNSRQKKPQAMVFQVKQLFFPSFHYELDCQYFKMIRLLNSPADSCTLSLPFSWFFGFTARAATLTQAASQRTGKFLVLFTIYIDEPMSTRDFLSDTYQCKTSNQPAWRAFSLSWSSLFRWLELSWGNTSTRTSSSLLHAKDSRNVIATTTPCTQPHEEAFWALLSFCWFQHIQASPHLFTATKISVDTVVDVCQVRVHSCPGMSHTHHISLKIPKIPKHPPEVYLWQEVVTRKGERFIKAAGLVGGGDLLVDL